MRLLAKLVMLAVLAAPASGAVVRSVDVVSGWDKPPYVIAQGDTGFEIELVKSVLQNAGYEPNMMYVPMGRSVRLVKERDVDVALSVSRRNDIPEAWFSDVYVVYQNVVVTLKNRNLSIERVDDLKNHTVVAFQTASEALGPQFSQAVAKHKGYLEMADQHRQVSMLLLGSVDAIVLDRNIFEAIRSKHPKGQDVEVTVHELFDVSPYHAVIPSKQLRDKFNLELAKFRESGDYQALANEFSLINLLDSYVQYPFLTHLEHTSDY